jgi:hypothetical protein
MAISFGFFNSLNGDRTYDADQMSEYFDGLISNGVYESVGGALQVKAVTGGGMNVQVMPGRGIINCKWISNNSALILEVTAAHAVLNRWTAVVMRLDIVNRLMTITTKDGTPASTPTKPSMDNTASVVELCLAYIYVGAGVTSISQANIEDMRASDLCGWVTGLIDQVDTSELFLQWQTAYENYFAEMTAEFDDWLSTLTSQLNVNTYIQEYNKNVTIGTSGATNVVALDMQGYTYEADDIIYVYVNGLYDTTYTLDTSGATPTITTIADADGTEISIKILKSKIGFSTLVGSNGNEIVDQNGNSILMTI